MLIFPLILTPSLHYLNGYFITFFQVKIFYSISNITFLKYFSFVIIELGILKE